MTDEAAAFATRAAFQLLDGGLIAAENLFC
jgi:hypothetical protein